MIAFFFHFFAISRETFFVLFSSERALYNVGTGWVYAWNGSSHNSSWCICIVWKLDLCEMDFFYSSGPHFSTAIFTKSQQIFQLPCFTIFQSESFLIFTQHFFIFPQALKRWREYHKFSLTWLKKKVKTIFMKINDDKEGKICSRREREKKLWRKCLSE